MSFDVLRQEHNNVIYSAVNSNNYLSSYNTVPVGKMFKEIILNNNLNKTNMNAGVVICRMRSFELPIMGIKQSKGLKLPVYNNYFILVAGV